jgi:hypothetical protein
VSTWQVFRRGTAVVLASATFGLGLSSVTTDSASAPGTIACVSNRLGLVRFVDDASQCRFWETAQVVGGGDSGVKFAFVTSTVYAGDLAAPDCTGDCSTGISRARFECNRLAAEVELPGEYEPWLSDFTSNAIDRFTARGANGPWFNVKGALVATSLQGLVTAKNSEFLYNSMMYTELGAPPSPSPSAWTGTGAHGVHSGETCLDWTSSSDMGLLGFTDETIEGWTDVEPFMCSVSFQLYCFQ